MRTLPRAKYASLFLRILKTHPYICLPKEKAMQNIFRLIMGFVITAVVMISCNTATSNDPNVVLQDFFDHLAKKDIDGASKYVTADSKPTMQMMKKGLEMAEKMKDSLPDKDFTKEFDDVTMAPARVEGDSAFITVSSSNHQQPDAEFTLLKESNGWKVDFTMSRLMKMGMKGAEAANIGNFKDSAVVHNEDVQKGLKMADSVLKNLDPKLIDELQKKLESLK